MSLEQDVAYIQRMMKLYEAEPVFKAAGREDVNQRRNAAARARQAELADKLADPVWSFCYDHYYADPDSDGVREKRLPFDSWDDDDIEDQVDTDAEALRRFMAGTYRKAAQ